MKEKFGLVIFLALFIGFGDTSTAQSRFPSDYSPFLVGTTSLGAYAEGEIPFHDGFYIRLSVVDVNNELLSTDVQVTSSRRLLLPVQIGTHIPIFVDRFGKFEYILHGDASAGVLIGWTFPENGNFWRYSMPNSLFACGSSAYLGVGNTDRISPFVELYINGGVSYFDLFSGYILPRSRYFIPNVSTGFYFGFGLM